MLTSLCGEKCAMVVLGSEDFRCGLRLDGLGQLCVNIWPLIAVSGRCGGAPYQGSKADGRGRLDGVSGLISIPVGSGVRRSCVICVYGGCEGGGGGGGGPG